MDIMIATEYISKHPQAEVLTALCCVYVLTSVSPNPISKVQTSDIWHQNCQSGNPATTVSSKHSESQLWFCLPPQLPSSHVGGLVVTHQILVASQSPGCQQSSLVTNSVTP